MNNVLKIILLIVVAFGGLAGLVKLIQKLKVED